METLKQLTLMPVPYAGALGVTALAKDDYRVIWPIPR